MATKGVSIQDEVLSKLVRSGTEVNVILINGFQMPCKVISYDNFVVMLEQTGNGRQCLVYKHAISTIMLPRNIAHSY